MRWSSAWQWSLTMTQRKDAKIAVMEQKFLLSPWTVWTYSADTFSGILVLQVRTTYFVSPDNKSEFTYLLSICWTLIQMGREENEKYWNLMPAALKVQLTGKHVYELLFPCHNILIVIIPTWLFQSYYFYNPQNCQEVLL